MLAQVDPNKIIETIGFWDKYGLIGLVTLGLFCLIGVCVWLILKILSDHRSERLEWNVRMDKTTDAHVTGMKTISDTTSSAIKEQTAIMVSVKEGLQNVSRDLNDLSERLR